MKKNKCKEVLILGDKNKVIKRLERRAKEAISAIEQLMIGMPFSKSQVDRMVQWKLEGDEVFFQKCFGPEPTDAKQLERMFLEDKDVINDEGYRIVKPMEREIAHHEQTNGIIVTFLAVRCKVKQV